MTTPDHRWPCESCGADLTFSPGDAALVCGHCGHRQAIPAAPPPLRDKALREITLQSTLSRDLSTDLTIETRFSRCPSCGAEIEFDDRTHAKTCPFCDTPVVTDTGKHRLIKPQAVLPFVQTERQAREAMVKWLGRLWFAPNGLQEYARKGRALSGVYVPWWTFDAASRSRYSGQRGDAYYVTETRTVMVNGKSETRREQVRKIRWTPVSGWVSRFFDDWLVMGSTGLNRRHADALAPWDLTRLEPYSPDFLSGMRAESYTVDLPQAAEIARDDMSRVISQDVRHAIGGDEQRIIRIDTQWSEETFKHILLPVWMAAYRYNGKAYRFIVNGQTGKVQGERPWSIWKIALAVLLALAVGAVIAALGGVIDS
jgi:predicted RNA-binding Zn-ribbon protein involved in translation (DUF1610 family)